MLTSSTYRDTWTGPVPQGFAMKLTPAVRRRCKSNMAAPKRSGLEEEFLLRWDARGGPVLLSQVRFHLTRKWRADFAWIGSANCLGRFPPTLKKLLIELDGGTWVRGRHVRGQGFRDDCEKQLEAVLLGWHVVRLTRDMLDGDYLDRLIAWCRT